MKSWRKVHRDIFENEDLGVLSSDAFQLYTALIVYADDEGRLKASPAYLRGKAFRYRDDVKTADVKKWRDQLVAGGFVTIYSVEGEEYAHHHNWEKWQGKRADRFEPSKLPEPCGLDINKVRQPLGTHAATSRQPLGTHAATSRQPLGTPEEIREEKKRGEGEAPHIRNDNNIVSEKGKTDGPAAPPPAAGRPAPLSASPSSLPSPKGSGPEQNKPDALKKDQFPEADILAVAAAYCEAKHMEFCNAIARSSYLRSKAVFYDAKDFLALNGGDVERACIAVKDFAREYEAAGKKDWNWKYLLQDWSKPEWGNGITWDELRRNYELEQQQEKAR